MATHQSALKRARQNEKRRLRNLRIKSSVKTIVKKVRQAVEAKDLEAARREFQKAVSLIQKARSKGVFHKNNAARKISRLSRLVNSLEQPAAS